MAITAYVKYALTGGGGTALDSIDGAELLDGDIAFVALSSYLYVYILKDDATGAESSPDKITPDANAGDKRWILQGVNAPLLKLANTLIEATAAEINKLHDVTAGTTSASKALVVGASKELDALTVTALTATLTGNVTGNLTGNVTGNTSGSSGSCTGNAATATTATTVSDASISQAKLKTSTGEVSIENGSANLTLPGGEYGFYPQVKGAGTNATYRTVTATISNLLVVSTYVTNIYLTSYAAAGYSAYAQQRYVTSSGEVFWVFILRDKITKEIIASYSAPDHPCFGNGGDPDIVSHPFPDFNIETQEIVVINPSKEEIKSIYQQKGKKSLLQSINEDHEIDEESSPAWPTKEVTVGLPEHYEWPANGEKVTTIKKRIPKPEHVFVKTLIKKSITK